MPDLAFTSVVNQTPRNPTGTQVVTVDATIINAGGIAAPAFRWDVARDGVPGFRSGQVPGLAAGSTTPLTFTVQETDGANHRYVITIDADHVVSEAVESDNQTIVDIAFTGGTHDLMVLGIPTTFPSSPVANDRLTITAVFKDASPNNQSLVNVPWRVTRDGLDLAASGTIGILNPNIATSVTIVIGTEAVGTHVYRVTIDPDHTIPDVDPGNNSAEVSVAVSPSFPN